MVEVLTFGEDDIGREAVSLPRHKGCCMIDSLFWPEQDRKSRRPLANVEVVARRQSGLSSIVALAQTEQDRSGLSLLDVEVIGRVWPTASDPASIAVRVEASECLRFTGSVAAYEVGDGRSVFREVIPLDEVEKRGVYYLPLTAGSVTDETRLAFFNLVVLGVGGKRADAILKAIGGEYESWARDERKRGAATFEEWRRESYLVNAKHLVAINRKPGGA